MGKTRLLVSLNFVFLLVWWFLLNYLGEKESSGNIYFSLGMGLFSLVFSLVLAVVFLFGKNLKAMRFSAAPILLGMCFFGLGTLVWFYQSGILGIEVPFPGLADVFYVLQFPLTVFGLFGLGSNEVFVLREGRNRSFAKLFTQMVCFLMLIGILLFLIAVISLDFYLDWESLLTFYFPLESVSLLVLILYIYSKYLKGKKNWVVKVILAQATWLAGDLFFFYEYLTGRFFNASYPDLLYLLGVFLVFSGALEGIKYTLGESESVSEEAVFLKRVMYKIPVSLNIWSSKR